MTCKSNSIYKFDNDSVVWSLPCFFQYEVILGAFQSSLEMLGFNHLNVNAFGSPATKWSGGRAPVVKDKIDRNKLLKLFNYISNLNNAVPTFTFSRINLTKDDLNDEYANFLLDFALEHNARFIVSSDILRDYIKNKKSSAVVVASILKSITRFQGKERIEDANAETETNYYNKLLKDYDIVVVRPEYSKTVLLEQPDLIDDISRIEVLINQLCFSNCPNAPLHNDKESGKHINDESFNSQFFCYKTKLSLKQLYLQNSAHTEEEVKTLINYGVRQLKLQGRGEFVPYLLHMVNLATQIFNFDGANSLLLNSVLQDRLMIEKARFNAFVDPQNNWKFDGCMNGLTY